MNIKKILFFITLIILSCIPLFRLNAATENDEILDASCTYNLSKIISEDVYIKIDYNIEGKNDIDLTSPQMGGMMVSWYLFHPDGEINDQTKLEYDFDEESISQEKMFTYSAGLGKYQCNDLFYTVTKISRETPTEKDILSFNFTYSKGQYTSVLKPDVNSSLIGVQSETIDSVLDIHPCQHPSFLNALYIVQLIIKITKIFIPILLIVTSMIVLAKSIVKSQDGLKEAFGAIKNKLILAICIYLIPTIIMLLLKTINADVSYYAECLNNSSSKEIVNYYDTIYKNLKSQKEGDPLNNPKLIQSIIIKEAEENEIDLELIEMEESDYQLAKYISTWEGTTQHCTTSSGNDGYLAVDIGDGVISVGAGLTNLVPELSNIKLGKCYDKKTLDNLKYSVIINTSKKGVVDYAKAKKLDLSDTQINALASFSYNAGGGAAQKAIDAYIKDGNKGLTNYMKKVITVSGKVWCPLVKRRDQEIELFVTGGYSSDFYARTNLRYYTSSDGIPSSCNVTYSR